MNTRPRPRPARRRSRRGGRLPDLVPDILYHATTLVRAEGAREATVLEAGREGRLFLSSSEEQAWRVAHRNQGVPVVLVVDAARARRDGARFTPVRPGLWQTASVPLCHVLNLLPGFAEQVSAGGVVLWEGPNGPEIAMISVSRRYGSTWEVAKGKLEPGETPDQACLREIVEEMGIPEAAAARMEILSSLGAVRYGFQTPAGEPRLKTLHIFLVSVAERVARFEPARNEGIVSVEWFTPVEAARRVHHRSLRPVMEDLVRQLCPDPEHGDEEEDEGEENEFVVKQF